MSKLKPGDRVSFLYFGEKVKGVLVKPHQNYGWLTKLDSSGLEVWVPETSLKKLKPKKTRRECWVVYRKADGLAMNVYDTLQDVNTYVYGLDNNIEVVHMREVRK